MPHSRQRHAAKAPHPARERARIWAALLPSPAGGRGAGGEGRVSAAQTLLIACALLTSACGGTLPDPLGPTPGLPPLCDASAPPTPHRLLAEHLLTLAAILDAASLTTPSLAHPLTRGWLASLPAASQSLPALAAAAEAAFSPTALAAHLACDAPPLALAQYRISAALTRVAISHPNAARLAAESLLSWLSPPPSAAPAAHAH